MAAHLWNQVVSGYRMTEKRTSLAFGVGSSGNAGSSATSSTREQMKMAISFYDASVASYIQVMGAAGGVLEKSLAHFHAKGIDPETIVDTRLAPDMLPFSFQIHSIVHHSLGAIEGIKSGVFRPPGEKPPHTYVRLQALLGDALSSLKKLSPADVNALETNDVVFEIRGMKMPFTASGFLLSFSLPNFYFHATTAYDILRSHGAPLGKRDFMGTPRMKG
jgi:hypothetical protein